MIIIKYYNSRPNAMSMSADPAACYGGIILKIMIKISKTNKVSKSYYNNNNDKTKISNVDKASIQRYKNKILILKYKKLINLNIKL